MTTTELDQIHTKATALQEQVSQLKGSIDELCSSPLAPPVRSPAYQNLNKAEDRFVEIRRGIEYVLATHGLATLLRRVGGEVAMGQCANLLAKMHASLTYLEQQINLANSQLAVAAIAVANRAMLPGESIAP